MVSYFKNFNADIKDNLKQSEETAQEETKQEETTNTSGSSSTWTMERQTEIIELIEKSTRSVTVVWLPVGKLTQYEIDYGKKADGENASIL